MFLRVKNISYSYGSVEALKDISFDVPPGEFLGIIGPNGAGKSTLIRCLSRVLKPKRGAIFLDGRDIREMKTREVARLIAVVPQDTVVNFSFTSLEIVLMGRFPYLRRLEMEGKYDYAVAQRALAYTDTLHLADRLIDELSGGERQRVIIARALAQEPKIILLDEPTVHLDINHQVEIFDLIRRLNRKDGLVVIAVLHDLNLAAEYCHRLILLDRGKIYADGSPQEIITVETIRKVYGTEVLVRENPKTGSPYLILLPGDHGVLKEEVK